MLQHFQHIIWCMAIKNLQFKHLKGRSGSYCPLLSTFQSKASQPIDTPGRKPLALFGPMCTRKDAAPFVKVSLLQFKMGSPRVRTGVTFYIWKESVLHISRLVHPLCWKVHPDHRLGQIFLLGPTGRPVRKSITPLTTFLRRVSGRERRALGRWLGLGGTYCRGQGNTRLPNSTPHHLLSCFQCLQPQHQLHHQQLQQHHHHHQIHYTNLPISTNMIANTNVINLHQHHSRRAQLYNQPLLRERFQEMVISKS